MKGAKNARVQYQYTYKPSEHGPAVKSVVVHKKLDRKGPNNLIDMLITQKANMYEREERLRDLREQDE